MHILTVLGPKMPKLSTGNSRTTQGGTSSICRSEPTHSRRQNDSFRAKTTSYTPSNVASQFWSAANRRPENSAEPRRSVSWFTSSEIFTNRCIAAPVFTDLVTPGHRFWLPNPEEAFGLPNDRGGNDLFYGPKEELHALWDIGLVAEIADTFDFRSLEAFLRREYAPFLSPVTPGDYHHWAETWALESVKVANSAYAGIRFNSVETMGPENQLWISITLPPDYHQKSSALAARQLTKAAVRLAQLLDRIRWP